jgi:hypothetical protein
MSSLREDAWMAACFLLVASSLPNLHAAEKKMCDKDVAWQQIDIDAARKHERPILLYIYDPKDMRLGTAVKQQRIFNNRGVKQAFAQFTPVMQPVNTTNWPAQYTAHAKNGYALLIMTCDAKPVAVFTDLPEAVRDQRGNEEYPMLREAASTALKANPKVLEAMRKATEPAGDAVASLLDGATGDAGKKAGGTIDRKGAGKSGNEVE